MDLQTATRFIQLANTGNSIAKISHELGIAPTTVSRQFTLLKVHGEEVFIDHFVYGKRPTYTRFDRACIIEYMIENNISSQRASAIFRIGHTSLERALNKRKALDKPLCPEASASKAIVPKNIGQANEQAIKPKQPVKTVDERTFLQATGNSVEHKYDLAAMNNGENLVYSSKDDQPKPKIDAQPLERPIGRAKAPVTAYVPPKVNRRKDLAAEKKAQERQKARTLAANSVEEAVEPQNSRLSKDSHWTDPNPPLPAQVYFDRDGKVPSQMVFDPNSERFDELPLAIIMRSYKRIVRDLEETNACLKKFAADISKILD